jgi:hypothetical protein
MEGTTSLWWDMETCSLPPYFDPYIVVSMAPALLRNFNIITSRVNAGGGCSSLNSPLFSAYEFFSETQTELHQTLINSGIGLQQLPPGNNNEMEKRMMADVLLWAMDTPPPANIILIVGNVDFCYVFQKLRQRSYNVFLVCQSMSEMPQGMLGGVNNCLGWLSFLRSLQNEDQSHFPGGISVSDHTFLNTAFPASSTPIPSKEMEDLSNASGLNYSQENLLSLKPSIDGWNSTRNLPATPSDGWDSTRNLPATPSDGWDSTCNLPATPSDGWDSTRNLPATPSDGWDSTCNLPHTISDGWDSTCNFPLDERARSPVQPEPRFHGPFIRTKKPGSSVSSASSTSIEKKKPASLEEFKAWLTLVINGKKHAEEGYNISPIRVDFEKATGKILDEKFLGFSKIINLVEDCKDIAVIKEVKRGCHLAFPVKPNEQKNFTHSPGKWNSNPNKKFQSKDKPRAGTNPKPKPKRKASAEDLRKFIYHLLQAGEFTQGFLMARLPKRFEQHTGKILDVEHLGYKRVSELVASYSDLVSVRCVGPGPVRIFPSGFVNEPVPNLYPNSNTIEVNSINMDNNSTNVKAKVEVDRPSSGGSGKELIENFDWEENVPYGHSPYMNYESQWLPMTFGCFNPREANSPAFQEYSVKSDSSSPPGGSQVSEWEGQYSNAIGETMSFHGELEGSDFIKQHVSTPRRESNDPIEDSVNAECLIAEAMQNVSLMKENTSFCEESNDPIEDLVNTECSIAEAMQNVSLMKENTSFCEEPCIPAGTGLPNSTPPFEVPSSEPRTGGWNSPLAPLQRRAECSAFCAEDLRQGIRLDCKPIEQNTSSAGNEEKTNSAVSSAGSIMQVAGRGLKSICEIWRKN